MADDDADADAATQGTQPRLARLMPAGSPASVAEIVEQFGLWRREAEPQRSRLLLNMVSTADGRATVAGRSGPISNAADRALFHGLRMAVDAVLVGAGTVRTERYGRLIANADSRAERVRRGLAEEPLACLVSGRLALDGDIPLLREPAARVAIITASAASIPDTAATVDYVRAGVDGRLDLPSAITQLRERFSAQSILCEGGPHLGYQLLSSGLVDELFLSLAPTLAGGEPAGGEALRIIAGRELDPPVELELLSVLRGDSQLFLRYGVCARDRVSRATTPSSSLDS
jgi:riboflavin biosynthesis pyrimidine reductase